MRVYLTVSFDMPEGATKSDARDYVREAIETWGGCYEPPSEYNNYEGDPFFGGPSNVKISFSRLSPQIADKFNRRPT